MAPNAIIRKVCSEARSVMYERCRLIGSGVMWFWLAKIINGSNQHVSTRRGVDNGSVARYMLEEVHPASDVHFSHVRLIEAIRRLCAVVVVHSHLGETSQIVGNSMIVGINTFSIVVNLGFVGGRFRECGLWQLVVLNLCLPHRQRKLKVA